LTYLNEAQTELEFVQPVLDLLGYASALVTRKIYDHWEGEFRAPAEAMDQLLEKASQNQNGEAFVRKTLEEGEGIECRPYRSRTCNTLIKRYRRIVPPSE
jgi:hypothetical protein